MFDIAPTELLMVALIALVVIGPKDLPRAMRVVGKWMGKARGMARHFRSGFDSMMREAELEELEKKWRDQNEDIMRQFPRIDDPEVPAEPAPIAPEPIAEPDMTASKTKSRGKRKAKGDVAAVDTPALAAPDAPPSPPPGSALP